MKRFYLSLVLIFLLFSFSIGSEVPDFSLRKLDGSLFRLSDHIGESIILIDFWATWCRPCQRQLVQLDRINKIYEDKVKVLAISIDDSSALPAVRNYVNARNFSFTVLLDQDSSVCRLFNPSRRIPFAVLISKEGRIVYTHSGYMPGDENKFIQEIDKLLEDKG